MTERHFHSPGSPKTAKEADPERQAAFRTSRRKAVRLRHPNPAAPVAIKAKIA